MAMTTGSFVSITFVRRVVAVMALCVFAIIGLQAVPAFAGTKVAQETLSTGSRGTNVEALHYLLNYWGYNSAWQGDDIDEFGSNTHSAVRAFQGQRGLTKDGIVGPNTWYYLTTPIVKYSSTNSNLVKAVTVMLDKWDGKGISSTYTTTQKNRVKAFQTHMGLVSDGIVGKNTWKYLAFHYEQPESPSDNLCPDTYGSRDWGTAATVAHVDYAGSRLVSSYGIEGRVKVNELSLEHGGDISGHNTHEEGMDVDTRPMGKEGWQCYKALSYTDSDYSRYRTELLHYYSTRSSKTLGRDLHRVTYFNDPVLYDKYPDMQYYSGHHNHLHISFCTAYYKADPAYDC